MSGLLVSFGVMTWIVVGAQLAVYNSELKFVEKNVSVDKCAIDMDAVYRTYDDDMSE